MALFFILLTIVLTAAGQIMIKHGVNQLGSSDGELMMFALRALLSPWVIGGFVAAFGAAVSWIVAMSKTELSFAYPFMGLGIVLTLALSAAVLGESVPMNRWGGVAVVCFGIWIAAQ